MGKLLILPALTMMFAIIQAAPVSSNNDTPANSNTAIATTAPTANIPALKVKARHEITAVQQEIQLLEKATVRNKSICL